MLFAFWKNYILLPSLALGPFPLLLCASKRIQQTTIFEAGIAITIGLRCALEPHFSKDFYCATMLSRDRILAYRLFPSG